jgi:phage-related minor tail protein
MARSSDFTRDSLEQLAGAGGRAMDLLATQIGMGVENAKELETQFQAVEQALVDFQEKTIRANVLESVSEAVQDITRSFFDLFQTMVEGSQDAKAALVSFLQSVSQALFQKFVVEQIIGAISSAFSAAGAAGGGGGGGLAGLSALPDVTSAKGNVFRSGDVTAFQRGGIIGGPTLFPLGLAGEAGPEAILPLKRGPGGRLGVEASRPARRPGQNPFVLRNVSPGASNASTETELRAGSTRTTNVNFSVTTPNADSFKKSARQLTDQAVRSVRTNR